MRSTPSSANHVTWPCASFAGQQSVCEGIVSVPFAAIVRFEAGESTTWNPSFVKNACQKG